MNGGSLDDSVARGDEIVMHGGWMTGGVVRIGDTIRRPVGPWTPAVHALLRYLEDVGFKGAPRVLGFDEAGREVLTYLPSDPTPAWSDAALIATAHLVRQLHEALAGFVPPPDAVWRLPPFGRHAPNGHIGHNDLCPMNTVYADGSPYAFIDWDIAGPGRPLDDVAEAAIFFVAIRPDGFWPQPGCPTPPDRVARLRLFCDAYGVDERLGFLDAIEALLRDQLTETVELGAQGVWPHAMLLARGEDHFRRKELEWLASNRAALEDALR